MSATETTTTTQVYRVYIKATPQAIWDAITKPEWSQKYGYGGSAEYELRPGGSYKVVSSAEMMAMGSPELMVDGEVIEADPPNKLVQTWRMLMDAAMAAEGFSRLTYEIKEGKGGVTKLTVTHDMADAPGLAILVSGGLEDQGAGGGWNWILSDLKSLLETGESMQWQGDAGPRDQDN
jgi:uncharacterized protein YndB with AHSA1/START domain